MYFILFVSYLSLACTNEYELIRAIIHMEDSSTGPTKYKLFVEGDNLRYASYFSVAKLLYNSKCPFSVQRHIFIIISYSFCPFVQFMHEYFSQCFMHMILNSYDFLGTICLCSFILITIQIS